MAQLCQLRTFYMKFARGCRPVSIRVRRMYSIKKIYYIQGSILVIDIMHKTGYRFEMKHVNWKDIRTYG